MARTRSAADRSSSSMREIARAMARGSPAMSLSASDDEPLDLARPLADGGQLDVAKVLLGRVVLDEAVAAVNLHAVVGYLHGHLAGVELRHRRLQRRAGAASLQVSRPVREKPRGFDLRRRIRQLPLDSLKAGDRLAERLALPSVAQ